MSSDVEPNYRYMLQILIQAIDYSFLQVNGEYSKDLTYPVIDKVKFIKKQL